MGTVIPLALRMGYQRDREHLPGIPPFDGEILKRVWLNIFQVDALMSFDGVPQHDPRRLMRRAGPAEPAAL
ncbi:fungal specific transcription factor domain-containing protein [Candidatus Bathyarchaeota archaeon]|nr:fungal specific transcription factor domain-containing protein [Candidatus Bathyarchaeota archaeon]